MKKLLLTNWSFRRGLFLIVGVFIIIDSAQKMEWMGIIFGSYFAIMGIFQIGCATGNCAIPLTNDVETTKDEVQFEEVKLNK